MDKLAAENVALKKYLAEGNPIEAVDAFMETAVMDRAGMRNLRWSWVENGNRGYPRRS
jgi:hypothetical protein